MTYVYILRSMARPARTYVGVTNNLRRRLSEPNSGRSEYTSQFAPWDLEIYIAFRKPERAQSFERYLKKGGGWRFTKRWLV